MDIHATTQPLRDIEAENLPDIDYHNIKKAARVLRSLNHKLRQEMLKTIHQNQRITVTQLYLRLQIVQSVASQHLAILRTAGIVSTEREGKNIYYIINKEKISSINGFVKDILI